MNIKRTLSIIIMCVSASTLKCISASTDAQILVNHVKKSIEKSYQETSKLNNSILNIDGMSSSKVRHLLNNLCSLPNANYLEIGVWKGSTFISALYGNTESLMSSVAIDNWSEFGGPKIEFQQNTQAFLPNNSFQFYDQDCFDINKEIILKNPVNIYFYDGNHTAESQEKAFTFYNTIFADTFIAIIDDWNHPPVKIGTRNAFDLLNYTILFEQILPANGDTANWWNGLYVAVIKKN